MPFGHKNKIQVDIGDLQEEKENIATFLKSHLKVNVSTNQNKLTVDSETLSQQNVLQAVTKFIYHQNLNNTHWASLEGDSVKINRFKNKTHKTEKKQEKCFAQNINAIMGTIKVISLIQFIFGIFG